MLLGRNNEKNVNEKYSLFNPLNSYQMFAAFSITSR